MEQYDEAHFPPLFRIRIANLNLLRFLQSIKLLIWRYNGNLFRIQDMSYGDMRLV